MREGGGLVGDEGVAFGGRVAGAGKEQAGDGKGEETAEEGHQKWRVVTRENDARR